MFGKGKNLMEAAAKAATDYHKNPKKHEASESKGHEQAEVEGQMQMADNDELCPDCHAKIQKHLSKLRGPSGSPMGQ